MSILKSTAYYFKESQNPLQWLHALMYGMTVTYIRFLDRLLAYGPQFIRDHVQDTYHSKLLRLEDAKKLLMLEQDMTARNLEQILPFSDAKDLVLRNPHNIAVYQCACRAQQKKPCQPMDVCLIVGEPFADMVRLLHPRRTVLLWEDEGFSCEGSQTTLRVLYAQEGGEKRRRVAEGWIETVETHRWWWATTIPAELMPARQLWQAAHRRWDIENDLFNTLSTHWSLDHCFRHHPTAILNFILTLFITYVLLQSFYHRNLNPQRRVHFTLIGIAAQLYLGFADSGPAPSVAHDPRAPPL